MGLFTGPIIWAVLKQSASKRKILNQIKVQASKYNCQFTDYQIVNKAVFALDATEKYFFGISQNSENQSVLIPISNIHKIQILSETKGDKKEIKRLKLVVFQKNKEENSIYFYNDAQDNFLQIQEYEHAVKKITTKIETLL